MEEKFFNLSERSIVLFGIMVFVLILALLFYNVVIEMPVMCEMNLGVSTDFNNDYFSSETNGLITRVNVDSIGVKAPCDAEIFNSIKTIIERGE